MPGRITSPTNPPLLLPGSSRRAIRRPDLRDLIVPRPSAAPLGLEVDWDDLVIHRSWRVYESDRPGEVRYFMFELTQRDPGAAAFSQVFYKAVRFIRLTRVPRYLRQATSASGPSMVFEQMRDVLAALREQGVLFVNMIAKSPELPLIFSYGVQGVGSTPLEAQQMTDEAFAVLDYQLSGTYQQLMYKPITVEEGEVIARYQSQWSHLAMGRGRPMPASSSVGAGALLDGARTDIESTNNQLESFIRGMGDRSFLLSLVTVPLSPGEITTAWRNISQKLSDVRSETHGSRGVSAGVAFPLTMGTSSSDAHGTSHSTGTTHGVTNTEGTSSAVSHGLTSTSSDSISTSMAQGQSVSNSEAYGTSATATAGTNASQGVNASQSLTQGVGTSQSVGTSESYTATQGVNQSSSLTAGASTSSGYTNTTGTSYGTSESSTSGSSSGSGTTIGDSSSWGSGSNTSSGVNGGVLGIGANTGSGTNASYGGGFSSGTTTSEGTSNSSTSGSSYGTSASQSLSGSVSNSVSATNQVGSSQSLAHGVGVNQSASVNQSLSLGQTTGTSASTGSSQSLASGSSATATAGTGSSATATTGASSSSSSASSASNTAGTSNALATSQALNDAYAVTMSRTTGMTGSLAVAPSFGVNVSRQTFDAAKNFIGDMLEAQMRRYGDGVKSGAFLYQMFLVCPDRETLVGGAGLLKSAFWGTGGPTDQLPQPFHTITDFEPSERDRLLTHAAAFTSYRRREPNIELIEPFMYSSYVTPTEASSFVHPPVAEGLGLLAQHDSMPVMRMPADRQKRDLMLGRIINGERGIVSDWGFGVDLNELTHTLIAGTTGSGKTTTLLRLLAEAVRIERVVVGKARPGQPAPLPQKVPASVLALDWMQNMRDLASIPGLVESDRFRFYSLLKPELGEFRFNPLAVPADTMSTNEWLNAQADNFAASFDLGKFGRSLIAEFLTDLYGANRLEPYVLLPAVVDEATGVVTRPAVELAPIDASLIPAGGITTDASGRQVATAFTCPALSRCVSMTDLATIVAARVEQAATVEGARLMGQQMRDRLQSLWRRMAYFAPGGQFVSLLACDPDPQTRTTLGVLDLIDPDKGLVVVIETDGLDLESRRLVLGSVLLAIYRYGLHFGKGVFDHNGRGPGAFVVLEESHELFGVNSTSGDQESIAARTELYEGMFRRVRALGLRLVAVAQQPSSLPEAVTANVSTVFVHNVKAESDRKSAFSLLNWSNAIGQQVREFRYLGEMPTGYCIARLSAKEDYTESAPVHFRTEPAQIDEVDDAWLADLARRRTR
jgi:hypothetical protein